MDHWNAMSDMHLAVVPPKQSLIKDPSDSITNGDGYYVIIQRLID
jgi:hypothetical protein